MTSNTETVSASTHTACIRCTRSFDVSEAERAFLQKVSPRIAGVIAELPIPSHCPECRLQRRMAHRNQIYVTLVDSSALYDSMARGDSAARADFATRNANVFSMYFGSPRFPVCSNEYWWREGDWEPLSYGRSFDFSRPFFDQWRELRDVVPRPALNIVSGTIQNSDFCNNALSLLDCYFCFDADRSRGCLYVETLADCTDCMDCSSIVDCELCYDCAGCTNCYNLQASDDSTSCSDSWYLSGCKSCRDCFGCVNLRHKQYCVYNKQLTEAEFRNFISGLSLASWQARQELSAKFAEFRKQHPRPHLVATRADNCTGNHIHNSRNIEVGFQIHNAEDLRYCDIVKSGAKDCQDCTISFVQPELMYETAVCGLNVSNLVCCYNCWEGASELQYCDTSHGSKNCFGCVGLRKGRFSILNKQYSESAYNDLAQRIVAHMRETGEWGEFFPMSHSPWPYNVSLASRYFPLDETTARKGELAWVSTEPVHVTGARPGTAPDTLPSSDDSFVVQCEVTGKGFRITSHEIRRLRQFAAPLPRVAYDQRMNARAERCGGMRLVDRVCAQTGESLRTVYTEESDPILWSKSAFDREFE